MDLLSHQKCQVIVAGMPFFDFLSGCRIVDDSPVNKLLEIDFIWLGALEKRLGMLGDLKDSGRLKPPFLKNCSKTKKPK